MQVRESKSGSRMLNKNTDVHIIIINTYKVHLSYNLLKALYKTKYTNLSPEF